jgi:multiple antibiotic resistance protein
MPNPIIEVVIDSLYILALLNPVSKISVLSSAVEYQDGEMQAIANKSTVIAAIIFIVTMIFGDFILQRIFHLQLYSLRLAGGVVLFWVGFNALQKGVFFEKNVPSRFADLAIVPLACPMIAGPASITASLALTADKGLFMAISAVMIALFVNLLIMRITNPLSRLFTRFNILGALIRITGLIVMTMGMQMALDGIVFWIDSFV